MYLDSSLFLLPKHRGILFDSRYIHQRDTQHGRIQHTRNLCTHPDIPLASDHLDTSLKYNATHECMYFVVYGMEFHKRRCSWP